MPDPDAFLSDNTFDAKNASSTHVVKKETEDINAYVSEHLPGLWKRLLTCQGEVLWLTSNKRRLEETAKNYCEENCLLSHFIQESVKKWSQRARRCCSYSYCWRS